MMRTVSSNDDRQSSSKFCNPGDEGFDSIRSEVELLVSFE
jgi:hypothetical protein